jgi:hypothetical protein
MDLLPLIKELNDMLLRVYQYYDLLVVERNNCNAQAQKNKAFADELVEREKEIATPENKQRLMKDIEVEANTVKERRKVLMEDIERHRRNEAALEVKKAQQQAEYNDNMKICSDWQDKLRKEQAGLDAEKKTYKEDIQKTIDKQLRDRGIKL